MEKEMATHSSVLAWRIPWTEKPGGLQSVGSHRVGHDWSNLAAAGKTKQFFLLFLCSYSQCFAPPYGRSFLGGFSFLSLFMYSCLWVLCCGTEPGVSHNAILFTSQSTTKYSVREALKKTCFLNSKWAWILTDVKELGEEVSTNFKKARNLIRKDFILNSLPSSFLVKCYALSKYKVQSLSVSMFCISNCHLRSLHRICINWFPLSSFRLQVCLEILF